MNSAQFLPLFLEVLIICAFMTFIIHQHYIYRQKPKAHTKKVFKSIYKQLYEGKYVFELFSTRISFFGGEVFSYFILINKVLFMLMFEIRSFFPFFNDFIGKVLQECCLLKHFRGGKVVCQCLVPRIWSPFRLFRQIRYFNHPQSSFQYHQWSLFHSKTFNHLSKVPLMVVNNELLVQVFSNEKMWNVISAVIHSARQIRQIPVCYLNNPVVKYLFDKSQSNFNVMNIEITHGHISVAVQRTVNCIPIYFSYKFA